MSNEEDRAMLSNAQSANGSQPPWPAFAPKLPARRMATSLDKADTMMVSVGSAAPAPMSLGHLAALVKDGRTVGQIHIDQSDGTVRTAPFALLRACWGVPKPGAPVASAPIGHP